MRVVRILLVAIALVAAAPPRSPARADDLHDLARCLSERGTVLYGAWWCPYCRKQLEAFGDAAGLLPYVECSDPGTRNKRAVCRDADVRGYPTWQLPQGRVRRGVQSPATLAALAGCG